MLTVALVVAAHATAGGGLPAGGAVMLLVLLGATIGLLAATVEAADFRTLLALLAVGQLLGHAVLSAVGHSHASTSSAPWGVMLAAHVGAVAIGAGLITVGGYLCETLSHALLTSRPQTPPPVASVTTLARSSADQPLRSALLLAASVSHRGPPVSLAR